MKFSGDYAALLKTLCIYLFNQQLSETAFYSLLALVLVGFSTLAYKGRTADFWPKSIVARVLIVVAVIAALDLILPVPHFYEMCAEAVLVLLFTVRLWVKHE